MPKRANDKANGVQKPLTLPEVLDGQAERGRAGLRRALGSARVTMDRLEAVVDRVPGLAAVALVVDLGNLTGKLDLVGTCLCPGEEEVAAAVAGDEEGA